jgi:hypothetical protein
MNTIGVVLSSVFVVSLAYPPLGPGEVLPGQRFPEENRKVAGLLLAFGANCHLMVDNACPMWEHCI